MKHNIFKENGAEWIWTVPGQDCGICQYLEFRHTFQLPSAGDEVRRAAQLAISADSDYVVWLNGEFIDCGQYDDFPTAKVYDVLDLELHSGTNVLCILVFYQGESSSQYKKGHPGLIYTLTAGGNCVVTSGSDVLCRLSPTWKNGSIAKLSLQLGFTFEYDAHNDDGWYAACYTPNGEWRRAEVLGTGLMCPTEYLSPRPVSKLVYREPINAQIVSQGVFIRRLENGDIRTPAALMQSDYLSYKRPKEVFYPQSKSIVPEISAHNDGVYIVFDLGAEESGLFTMDITACEGTVIDIGHGEHLQDLRVRTRIGERNFANRHICRKGRQQFTNYFKRIGGRYLQLHIVGPGEEFTIHHAGIIPWEYPLANNGFFECNDSLHNKIYEVSRRTLQLCMHEHYEDTPWREQSLYAMDSRNQALCGYYCFGEYAMPAASFTLLGMSLRDDGFLDLCAPCETPQTIPSFSLIWIVAAWEYILYSDDTSFLRRIAPWVDKMLSIHLPTVSNGLLPTPPGSQYWHFYEWSQGMDGYGKQFSLTQGQTPRYDAPYNAFFAMALCAAQKIALYSGNTTKATAYSAAIDIVRDSFHSAFWDEKHQAYTTYSGAGAPSHFAELTQALALCADLCPNDVTSALRQRLAQEKNGWVECTLSHSIFKYEALMGESEVYGKLVFDRIASTWGHMLYQGATSFWETIKGAADFDNAGSLCHGWSGIPIYFYQRYLLGVRPLEPGFRRFEVSPVYSVLERAAGKIPTPLGTIEVAWDRTTKDECAVTWPEGIALATHVQPIVRRPS